MKIISITSPLIFLAKINKLVLLKKHDLIIPKLVFQEIENKKDQVFFQITKFVKDNNIVFRDCELLKELPDSLGNGEKAVISLAVKDNIKNVLVDEKKARIIADSFNLNPKGTIAILISALKNKEITKKECKSLIFDLLKKDFRIDQALIIDIINYIDNL